MIQTAYMRWHFSPNERHIQVINIIVLHDIWGKSLSPTERKTNKHVHTQQMPLIAWVALAWMWPYLDFSKVRAIGSIEARILFSSFLPSMKDLISLKPDSDCSLISLSEVSLLSCLNTKSLQRMEALQSWWDTTKSNGRTWLKARLRDVVGS